VLNCEPCYLVQVSEYCLALVNAVMNLPVTQKVGNFFTTWATISFSRVAVLCGVIIVIIAFIKHVRE
jgi:hypothetical protein